MAKKVVATLQKKDGKNLVKVIQSVRSSATGAYMFQERMVSSEQVKEVLAKA